LKLNNGLNPDLFLGKLFGKQIYSNGLERSNILTHLKMPKKSPSLCRLGLNPPKEEGGGDNRGKLRRMIS
jgi:hypothetical protein